MKTRVYFMKSRVYCMKSRVYCMKSPKFNDCFKFLDPNFKSKQIEKIEKIKNFLEINKTRMQYFDIFHRLITVQIEY